MAVPKTVLLVAADIDSLQARQEQLRRSGFATRTATNVRELQEALDQQGHTKISVAVVGSAIPPNEKLRITMILRDAAKRLPIVLLTDTEAGIVDEPDAVLHTKASDAEFVNVVRRVSTISRRSVAAD